METAHAVHTDFVPVLRRGLGIRLQTVVEKRILTDYLGSKELNKRALRNLGFKLLIRDTSVSLIHDATTNGVHLLDALYRPEQTDPLVITFAEQPSGLVHRYQQINIEQDAQFSVIGLICQRNTMDPERPERPPFNIKNENEDQTSGFGHLNLDCLSKARIWNPLYLKYRLQTMPCERHLATGYLKLDVKREGRAIVATIGKVGAGAVPENLRTARTFPR